MDTLACIGNGGVGIVKGGVGVTRGGVGLKPPYIYNHITLHTSIPPYLHTTLLT